MGYVATVLGIWVEVVLEGKVEVSDLFVYAKSGLGEGLLRVLLGGVDAKVHHLGVDFVVGVGKVGSLGVVFERDAVEGGNVADVA